jgi:hypothetical protein
VSFLNQISNTLCGWDYLAEVPESEMARDFLIQLAINFESNSTQNESSVPWMDTILDIAICQSIPWPRQSFVVRLISVITAITPVSDYKTSLKVLLAMIQSLRD